MPGRQPEDERAKWEREARAKAKEYYREILEEKRQAAEGSASSASGESERPE